MNPLVITFSSRLNELADIADLYDALATGGNFYVGGAAGSLPRILFASFLRKNSCKVLYVTPDPLTAEFARDDFSALIGTECVGYFCERSHIPKEYRLQNVAQLNARLTALERLLSNAPAVVVTTGRGMQEAIVPPEAMRGMALTLHRGIEMNFNWLLEHLMVLGFVRETIVDRVGEMSVRGGIIDLFPFSHKRPVRIEFFGNTVETMREFDPQTQRSTSPLCELTVFPQIVEARHTSEAHEHSRQESEPRGTLADYLHRNDIVVYEEPGKIKEYVLKSIASDMWPNSEALREEKSIGVIHSEADYTTVHVYEETSGQDDYSFAAETIKPMHGKFEALQTAVDSIVVHSSVRTPFKPEIFLLCESAHQKMRIETLIGEENVDLTDLSVQVLGLQKGFLFWRAGLFVITDHEFFNRSKVPRVAPFPKEGFTFRQLRALKNGDYVVHVDFGIGIYSGLKKITIEGSERECVQIEYRDGDKVYVNLERLDRIKKYASREGAIPQISKLGTVDWQRLKLRAKKRLKDISTKLIQLYAARTHAEGFAFSRDELWQHELEASFVYNETPDQLRATVEVKKDMESDKPMDRLICGDVGYGKTEVAIRAAFKAVNNGKQVAVLVPTTILAHQHYATFSERLAAFPVHVEMLSRFRSKRESEEILRKLTQGSIDIVIGTHRILSNDVSFKDLGLVIIDEEQRFGVRHKEKLKTLRTEVDVLTMTATPIPRTLHMALIGVRGMSRITTPPRDRLPIRTEVIQFNRDIIRQAILREISRGGQAFFVHNRVRSIEAVREMLVDLCPEARFAVAHGQMRERDLEKVMDDFLGQKYDCLVSSMIIESGLDIPNVNTLIVNRADRFGLAQLYQLRGRVGRSSQQAYAYLIVPTVNRLTRDAVKRLQALEEMTELGSGYQLALRDLEVRGAGNILGAEQSGFIDALGSDLFYKILDEAVREVKDEEGIESPLASPQLHTEVHVEFKGSAYIPESYIDQGSERVDIYRRLVEAVTLSEVEEIGHELVDRFGRLPEEVENLLDYLCIKILGNQNRLSNVKINGFSAVVHFDEALLADRAHLQERLGRIVRNASLPVEFDQKDGLTLKALFQGEEKPLCQAKKFLQSIV